MANDIFNLQIFFIIFREALEAVVILATLLAFVKQSLRGDENKTVRKKLNRQIWGGAIAGIFICLCVGGAFIGVYHSLGKDLWSSTEDLWEGIFCTIAAVLISSMGITMLRLNKMQAKWRTKIAKAITTKPPTRQERFKFSYLMKRYALWILPFLTTLREGVEAIVFVGGVGIGASGKSIPLPVVIGLLAGFLVGWIMYRVGSGSSLQVFLCISTCILYLIAAGLLSRGVWFFEANTFNHKTGGDAAESGNGPGSYDISKTVWHVNCCNPLLDNGWDVFNALLGWQNTATYGSVLSYNLYWLFLIVIIGLMLYQERTGHLPGTKSLTLQKMNPMYYIKHKDREENMTEADRQKLYADARQRIREQAEEVEGGRTNDMAMEPITEGSSESKKYTPPKSGKVTATTTPVVTKTAAPVAAGTPQISREPTIESSIVSLITATTD